MGQFAAPMNIDETLLSQKVSNTQLLVPRKMTVDTGLQTSSRRRRTKVLGLKQDELAIGSLMETGVGNGMIKSLHDTLRNQLKNLFDEIRKLSSKLQNSASLTWTLIASNPLIKRLVQDQETEMANTLEFK